MKSNNTNPEIVTKANGVFCVEDWFTEELIVAFKTNEERQSWLNENVDSDGYTKDGIKVSIYERF